MLTEALMVAGALHLAIAAGNLLLPRLFDYRRHLAALDLHIRQIHLVHAAYIIIVLLIFGVACLVFPRDLATTALGRFLSASLCLFWLLRLGLQVFYYDRGMHRRLGWLGIGFTGCVVYFVAVFAWAASGRG